MCLHGCHLIYQYEDRPADQGSTSGDSRVKDGAPPDRTKDKGKDRRVDRAREMGRDQTLDKAKDSTQPDKTPSQCTADKDCDDGKACTTEKCGKGKCIYSVKGGTCLISGVCYSANAKNPKNSCQSCTGASSTSWTNLNNSPCDDSKSCTMNDKCSGGGCKGTAYSCTDSISCNTDICKGNGKCDHPVLSTHCLAADGKTCQAKGAGKTNCEVCEGGNKWTKKYPCVSTYAGSTKGFADGGLLKAKFNLPTGISARNSALYVADYGNHAVRSITGGKVYTLAGDGTAGWIDGAVTKARFNFPRDVAVDSAGAVYVADSTNHCIRKIRKGQVSTVAGSPTPGKVDGYWQKARFNHPAGIAVDGLKKLYVADMNNNIIRLITLAP